MADKGTIDTTPDLDVTIADTLDAAAQYAGSTDSNSPYPSRNCKFPPYSTTTMKNQKKKENKIYDKVTINTTPFPDVPGSDTPNASAQDYGSADSNSPYSLRNHKVALYSTTTMKNQKKKENKIYDKETFGTPP